MSGAWPYALLAAAAGFALGWCLSRRGFHRVVHDLATYVESWSEDQKEDAEAAGRAVVRRPRALAAVFQKLDEHHRAFLSLRSLSNATTIRLQKLMNIVSEVILIYDPEGKLLFANDKVRELAARAAGRPPGEGGGDRALVSADVASFLAGQPELGELVRGWLQAPGEAGQRKGAEVTLRGGDEERRFLVTPHLIRSGPETPDMGLLLLLTDLEVLEELRRDGLRRLALEHVQLAAELLAHRIRNPLNSIVLVLELLRRESARSGGRPQGSLDTIQTEVRHLEGALDRFLEIVRRREARVESVDLASVVEAVSELLYPIARDAGVTIRQELRVTSAMVRGDAVEITRSVLGPALAALRASGRGADLKFRVDSERHEHQLLFEGGRIPPDSLELAVAEDLAVRNEGRLERNGAGGPTRLIYRFPVAGGEG